MATDDRVTHQTVSAPQPGDGETVSTARATQAYPKGASSRRTFTILIASIALVVAALGIYWAAVAPGLHRADQSGQSAAHGQEVTNPSVVATYHEPEPAPKQPQTSDIARSSGGTGG